MTEDSINVEGMTCEHCAKAIKKAVLALNGVEIAEVSLSNKKVNLKYDSAKVSLVTIKKEIENQGYDIANK